MIQMACMCCCCPQTHPRSVADSTDGGVSFGPAYQQLDLPEPTGGCQASSIVVIHHADHAADENGAGTGDGDGDGDGDGTGSSATMSASTVLFSNPSSGSENRSLLTLRRSIDGGKTYPSELATLVWPGAGGYSCLTQLSTTNVTAEIGLVFERSAPGCVGGSCRISFVRLPVHHATAAAAAAAVHATGAAAAASSSSSSSSAEEEEIGAAAANGE